MSGIMNIDWSLFPNGYTPTDEDIEYFRLKVDGITDPDSKVKAQKQLDLIEDAVIIYRLSRIENELDELIESNKIKGE